MLEFVSSNKKLAAFRATAPSDATELPLWGVPRNMTAEVEARMS